MFRVDSLTSSWAYLCNSSFMSTHSFNLFHVLVEIFKFFPRWAKHHNGWNISIGSRVGPIAILFRAYLSGHCVFCWSSVYLTHVAILQVWMPVASWCNEICTIIAVKIVACARPNLGSLNIVSFLHVNDKSQQCTVNVNYLPFILFFAS